MEKNDGGIGNWPVLLLLLSLIGAAATQVSQRAAPPAPGQSTDVGVMSGTAHSSQGAAGLLAMLAGMSAPESNASSESLRELIARAREAAALQKMSLEFLVATLPDYVDSNSGWSFDASLDAVQRAAGAAGFVFDRFVLPDWAPTPDGTNPAKGRQHEIEPGLVLFRKVDEVTAATKILAVLIATETPTAGIHDAAFLKAARIAAAWQEDGNEAEDRVLRVLGPTFSGSSPSLRRAITKFLESAPGRLNTVRVLSGTATNRGNQQMLTFPWPEPGDATAVEVSFGATVRTDDVMLHMLHDHLVEINSKWKDGAGIVLLVESNTGYGRSFAAQTADEQDDTAAAERLSTSDPFPEALRIPFPIHISRLRAEAERLRGTEPRLAGTAPGSTLRDIGPATDLLPSMTPQITAAAIDTLVASILATIRREEYQAIGIFATDKRDHLFLAERIVREVPNALLFTTEADLLYIHPAFRSFVRGAIVATTYPLFNATQSLTSPHLASLGRQQFSTMAAQGTYNAVLKLIKRDDLLLDYVSPGCLAPHASRGGAFLSSSPQCKRPSVWLSMVSRDGLWPIDYHPDEVPNDSYTEAINIKEDQLKHFASATDQSVGRDATASGAHHPNESGRAHALLHVAAWMKAAFILLLLALVVHGIKYLAEVSPASLWLKPGWLRRLLRVGGIDEPSLAGEHRLFLLIAFAILWFASVWAILLFRIWLDSSPIVISDKVPHPDSDNNYANMSIWYLVYGGVLALVVVESILTILQRRSVVPKGWIAGTIVTCVALFFAINAGFNLAGFLGSREWSDPVGARLLFARTVNPGNWASPAAPVLALLGVLYLWTLWNVRQLRMGGWKIRRESELFRLLTGYEPRLTEEVADIMVSPWRRQDWRCLAIPFGLVLTFYLYVPTWYTPDGRHFDRFLWSGSLLTMFLIAHSLAMTVHLWILVGRILQHLRGHPISDAFTRVAEEPFNWQLSLTPPRVIELKPLARKARALRFELRQVVGEADRIDSSRVSGPNGQERRRGAAPSSNVIIESDATNALTAAPTALMVASDQVRPVATPVRNVPMPMLIGNVATRIDAADVTTAAAGALMVRRQEVAPMVEILDIEFPDALDAETESGSIQPYFKSEIWSAFVILSDRLVPVLRHGFWHRGSAATRSGTERWYRNAEALIGMQAAFVLRDMLARLVSGMTVTIVGAVLALTSHLFYSFPGRSAMLAFDWIMVALAVTAAAAMLVHLEKDPVLNRLWSKAPGRLIWTGGFVYRLGLYGAVPIITLFAWQFPEVGGRLFGWIEPLQKAIP